VCTKFGALIATIPEPMIGAQLTISLGIVGGVRTYKLFAYIIIFVNNAGWLIQSAIG
jgi:hypothetical protein